MEGPANCAALAKSETKEELIKKTDIAGDVSMGPISSSCIPIDTDEQQVISSEDNLKRTEGILTTELSSPSSDISLALSPKTETSSDEKVNLVALTKLDTAVGHIEASESKENIKRPSVVGGASRGDAAKLLEQSLIRIKNDASNSVNPFSEFNSGTKKPVTAKACRDLKSSSTEDLSKKKEERDYYSLRRIEDWKKREWICEQQEAQRRAQQQKLLYQQRQQMQGNFYLPMTNRHRSSIVHTNTSSHGRVNYSAYHIQHDQFIRDQNFQSFPSYYPQQYNPYPQAFYNLDNTYWDPYNSVIIEAPAPIIPHPVSQQKHKPGKPTKHDDNYESRTQEHSAPEPVIPRLTKPTLNEQTLAEPPKPLDATKLTKAKKIEEEVDGTTTVAKKLIQIQSVDQMAEYLSEIQEIIDCVNAINEHNSIL